MKGEMTYAGSDTRGVGLNGDLGGVVGGTGRVLDGEGARQGEKRDRMSTRVSLALSHLSPLKPSWLDSHGSSGGNVGDPSVRGSSGRGEDDLKLNGGKDRAEEGEREGEAARGERGRTEQVSDALRTLDPKRKTQMDVRRWRWTLRR